ncbi:UDP-N-acetylglucosamine 2-epimerase, partial [Chloroflexota bacterium]
AGVTIKTLNLLRSLSRGKKTKYRALLATGWENIAPVVEELKKNAGVKVIFFGKEPVISKSSPAANILYEIRTFKDHETRETKARLVKASALFQERWPALQSDKSLRQIMTHLDIPLWDIVERRFCYLFSTRFAELANKINIIENMLNRTKTDIIVVNNGVSEFDRTLIAAANQKSIPSLINQREQSGHPISSLPISASKVAAWGQITRDWLVREGVSPDKIVITGGSRFDAYLKKSKSPNNGKGEIVLATQFTAKSTYFANIHLSPREDEMLLYSVVTAMKEFPDKQLVVKLHPSEKAVERKKRIIENAAQEAKVDNVTVVRSADLNEMLINADVLITPWSTVGLEAMILGKPVIQVNLSKRPDTPSFITQYADSGAAIGVSRVEDVAPAIRSILTDSEVRQRLEDGRKKYVYEYAYKQDGKASQRVADLIISMIEESRESRGEN